MSRIVVAERIAEPGLARLRAAGDVDVALGLDYAALTERVASADALVVRSATRVDSALIDAAPQLRVIGRAGTGVDNVDVEAATARGVLVCNAPESNAISAAEHTIALLLALARRIPQAHQALAEGRWERAGYAGVEVSDKTVAVLGFGRIGQLVTARLRGLGMRVVAYDPFVSSEWMRERGAQRAETLVEALAAADFVTLHLPAGRDTRRVIDRDAISAMPRGVRIINCARGDLIDPDALLVALDDGHVAGAALDVFEQEPVTASPFFGRPDVVVTPHLGASTREAQDRAGVVIADQVARALAGDVVANAVNLPAVPDEDHAALAPYLTLARMLGRVATGLTDGPFEKMEITFAGQIGERDTRLVTLAALRGALEGVAAEPVNLVNARAVAASRGIEVREGRRDAVDYTSMLRVATSPAVRVSGTTIGRDQRPWLVRVIGYDLEIQLGGLMLFLINEDRPGMIGQIGAALGACAVNIANMNVSRNRDGHAALTVLQIDGPLPTLAVESLGAIPGVSGLRVVDVDER